MNNNRTPKLLHVGDILWNEPCDERIVVVAANERNVWLRKVHKNDELAMHDGHVWSMLGKKRNAKNMCTQSYAQSVFELDGHVEQAIAATLESGALTAEQVREAIKQHSFGIQPELGYGEFGRCFHDKSWQAIADELNATLGGGECEFVGDAKRPPKCSACGWQADIYDCEWMEDGEYEYDGRYCKQCGAKVKAVE